MSTDKIKRTYRIRQLPAHVDALQAITLLVQIIEGLDSPSEIQLLSLASSIDPWERPPSKVATAKFHKLPAILDTAQNEWVLSTQTLGLRKNIIIDTHFLDFTVLNQVAPDVHALDCIAISGLASHPFGSWKSRSDGEDFMWLRDGVPKDLPFVRNIIYGYDTKLLSSQSFQDIDDLALSLVVKLRSIRNYSGAETPLCFIVHSLGGIIFKRALVILANAADEDRILLDSLKAVLFFGVPSKGMHMSHLLPMVAGQPNEALVNQLSPDSLYLTSLVDQFCGIAQLERMRIISLYETAKSQTTERLPSGEWARSGPYEILVDKTSAIHPGSRLTDTFPIDLDHSSMVKFSENDSNYRGVLSYLADVVRTLSNPVKSNALELEDPSTSSSTFRMEPAFIDGSQNVVPHTTDNAVEFAYIRNIVKESLKIEEGELRFESIEKPFQSTFQWIFRKTSLGFSEWLQTGRGIYWISGKPGSGKSTLMKYLCESATTKKILDKVKSKGTRIFASFFFYNRGTALQKSFEGLLRSILFQILDQEPELEKIALRRYCKKYKQFPAIWLLRDLESCFHEILVQRALPVNIHLFLDALDEYDGSLELFVDFLKSAAGGPPDSKTRIQICFSSRLWNIFIDDFASYPGFKIHQHTRADMEEYIDSMIQNNNKLSRLFPQQMDHQMDSESEIRQEIIDKAQGVFLWVRFVVDRIARSVREGASTTEIQRIMSDTPERLEELYKQILERIDSDHRQECYAMLEVALRSVRLLRVDEFSDAVNCAYQPTLRECVKVIQTHPHSAAKRNNMKRRLKSRCGGLLEVILLGGEYYVQLMHQTVKDFVSNAEFPRLALGADYSHRAENGFSFLSKYALSRIHASPSLPPVGFDAISYSNRAENTTGKNQAVFLNSLSDKVLRSFFFGQTEFPPRMQNINSVSSFATVADLQLFMSEQLKDPFLVNANPEVPLLHCAVGGSIGGWFGWNDEVHNSQMVQMLLDHGADENVTYCHMTPLQVVSRGLSFSEYTLDDAPPWAWKIMMLFFARGSNHEADLEISERGKNSSVTCKPLHVAASNWPLSDARAAIKLLLDRRADVNAVDSVGRTPMDVLLIYSSVTRVHDPSILQKFYKVALALVGSGAAVKLVSQRKLYETFRNLQRYYDISPFADLKRFDDPNAVQLKPCFNTRIKSEFQGLKHIPSSAVYIDLSEDPPGSPEEISTQMAGQPTVPAESQDAKASPPHRDGDFQEQKDQAGIQAASKVQSQQTRSQHSSKRRKL